MTSTPTSAETGKTPISIGIADDDALVRHTLSDLLSGTGQIHVAWTAKDGQEALDLLRSPDTLPVQALLLDVQMPRMDGLALAQTLHEEAPDLAVLILTTFVADSVMEQAMTAGVRGFVAKDDDTSSLAGAIQQAVAGNFVMSPTSTTTLTASLQADTSGQPASGAQHSSQRAQTASPRRPPRDPAGGLPHGVTLTSREQEILVLLVDALTNKQIARRLVLSEATVKTHVSAIISKLGVQDRVGAVVYALNNHLV